MVPISFGALAAGLGNIGSLLSGGASLGSLFSSGSSFEQSKKLMREQMDFQREMAAKQQDYWMDQFNVTNEYNDPRNAVRRYLNAGISPSAAFGGSAVGQSSAQMSVGSGGVPVGYPPTLQSGPQTFATIAQALSSLGSAFKNSAEGRSISQMMVEQLRGLTLTNDQKEFMLELDKLNLPKRQKQELANLGTQYLKMSAEIGVLNEDELLKMETRFRTIQERVNEITKGEMLSFDAEHYFTTWKSMIDQRKAQIRESNANARYLGTTADREEYFNKLRADPAVRASLKKELSEAGNKAVADRSLTESQKKELDMLVDKLAFSNSVQEFEYYWQKVREFLSDMRDNGRVSAEIISAFNPLKGKK